LGIENFNYNLDIMTGLRYIELEKRGVLTVTGEDAQEFLQSLVSNDVSLVDGEHTIYAALLTPQGKFLHDFMISRHSDSYLIDCALERLMDLAQRLIAYRLRANIELLDATEDWRVVALLGAGAAEAFELANMPGATASLNDDGPIYRDPRPAMPGLRALLPRSQDLAILAERGFAAASIEDYEQCRITAGVPDGSHDMTVGKSTLMEYGFEALHGVDFSKGCYVGQELTARTKYRGLVRRQLKRVTLDGALPPVGTLIMANGKEAGEICSGFGDQALALLRIDRSDEAAAEGFPLTVGTTTLHLAETEESETR
jgi:hypothetical protein